MKRLLDGSDFGIRDLGKFLPADLARKREQTQESMLAERQALWRTALNQACLDDKIREPLARKMYHGEAWTLEEWPGLAPLTAQERTLVIAEVKRIYGLPHFRQCRCPEANDGIHYNECWETARKSRKP